MKKAILAPLCSALVIPGMGQVINHDLKKGAAILGGAFVLLVATAVKFFQVLSGALEASWADPSKQSFLIDQLRTQDLSLMKWVSGAFLLIWSYSIIDAFLRGKKLDQSPGDVK
jgi:NADH:ubiquinone oxidoreductase subunit 5 (subunit L)/multisubunit Na+/H+ antiporter MnhA subunit